MWHGPLYHPSILPVFHHSSRSGGAYYPWQQDRWVPQVLDDAGANLLNAQEMKARDDEARYVDWPHHAPL